MVILYFSVAPTDNAASELDTSSAANGCHSLETYLTRFIRTQRSGKMRNDGSSSEIRDKKFALKRGALCNTEHTCQIDGGT